MADIPRAPTRVGAPAISPEVVRQFADIDTGCVADTLIKLGLHTVVEGFSPIAPGMQLCGSASTVRIMPAQDWRREPTEFNPNAVGFVLGGGCRTGDVLVMECGGRADRSTWGSMASLVAKENGLAGALIDGAARDIAQVLELDWPVFTRSFTVRGPGGSAGEIMVRTACVNSEPIQIGEGASAVTVVPGDLIVADEYVVCVVPSARAEEVLEQVAPYHEADLKVWQTLKREVPKRPDDEGHIRSLIAEVRHAAKSSDIVPSDP